MMTSRRFEGVPRLADGPSGVGGRVETVVAHFRCRGRHARELRGDQATGKKMAPPNVVPCASPRMDRTTLVGWIADRTTINTTTTAVTTAAAGGESSHIPWVPTATTQPNASTKP